MKIQNNQSSYPGMADGFISYEGSLLTNTVGYGHFGNGVWAEFLITTEIRSNLNVFIICSTAPFTAEAKAIKGNVPVGLNKTFLLPYKTELQTSGCVKVRVRVPHGCAATYKIMGDKNSIPYLTVDKETELIPDSFLTGFSDYSHQHDGIDSALINVGSIKPNAGNAGKFLRVSADGNYITYANSSGAPDSFSLLLPVDKALLNIALSYTAFTWEASVGANNYHIYIIHNITREVIYDTVTGNVTTININHSNFINGEVYYWYVVATNGTETIQSNTHIFTAGHPVS